MPSLAHKRGTRAQIDAAAGANALRVGEIYLITDEARLTVGTAAGAHQPLAKQGEGGSGAPDPWTWAKLAGDVANSSVTLAAVSGLSFSAVANATYIVELMGSFQAAANTTGIALALDIPSGAVSGYIIHNAGTTAVVAIEQVADNATILATSGVRNAATNVPLLARFIVAVGASAGPVQLMFRSEVAGSAVTMKAALTAMGWRAI
jgi:hypothetical protein